MIIFESVRWKNFLSTGNNFTEINLNKTNNTLIVGDNGAGKSTILDALTFALFGKPFRRITKTKLINSVNERDSIVELTFKKGKNVYLIRRGQKPALFEIYRNDELLNQTAKAKDYQKYLEKNVLGMNMKSFTQVVILGSSSFVPFMQLSASDRRDVVEDLLDIKVFSSMNDVLKGRSTTLRRDLDQNTVDQKVSKEKIRIQNDYVEGLRKKSLSNIESHRDEIDKTKKAIDTNKKKIKSIENEIAKIDAERNDLLSELKDTGKISSIKSKLDHRLESENKMKRFFENNEFCPTCDQTIHEDFRVEKLSSIKDKIQELDGAIKELEEKQEEARQIQNQADIHALSVSKLNVSLSEKEGLIRSNEQYIQKLEELVDEIQKQTTEIDTEIRKADILTKELDSINIEREDILKRAKIIGTLSELLKDSGIKTKIIRHYLPTMNRLINKYLSDMDFFVNFTIDENFNEVIKSRYRDEFNYDNFSEGEKFRIDISLLLTWREIAKRKNSVSTNLLILDEVFDSSLDTAGTDVFMKLLKSLGNKSNVFVISHRTDTIVDKFSSVIRFEKKNNFSRIAKD